MRIINNIKYYDLNEALQYLNMSKSTFYDQINSNKIDKISTSTGYLFSVSSIEKFKTENSKNKGGYFSAEDIKNDEWLKIKGNPSKVKEWNSAKRISWASFDLNDYIAYWHYIIKPNWVIDEKYLATTKELPNKPPTGKWLMKHKFKGFIDAINSKYLEKQHQIRTVSEFFKYIEKNKQW